MEALFEMPTPVLRPLLPLSERLLPYLRVIDSNRIYSNFGPLTRELGRRLSEHFSLPPETVVTAASGTAGLMGAILACAGRARADRPLALVPSFTFVATVAAVEACGYEVRLLDVDSESFLLDPARAVSYEAIDRVGLVVPVGAFGRPVLQSAWSEFRRKTGIEVVIDGAACFETATDAPDLLLGEIPVVMSFHATKSYATGEGGGVITTNVDLAHRTGQALNFGFHGARNSQIASINGKMSEYHAAVGLAELDGWSEKARALAGVSSAYRRHFNALGLRARFIGSPDIASCYALFRCKTLKEAREVAARLDVRAIEHRLWYGRGVHDHSYYRSLRHDGLSATEELAPLLIGLPMAPDLEEKKIREVVDALSQAFPSSARFRGRRLNDCVARSG
ncbi:MAG: hypothetical protein FJX48_01010 [Alphaproteobacteria bacterium]|nr:hypothetical protein [Alphaproteobacteria bacterium]